MTVDASGVSRRDDAEETFEHVSIIEYNEMASDYDRCPGDRAIYSGIKRDSHVRDDEEEGFVKIGEAVAIIELPEPMSDEEVTEWCNTQAGKLALGHWFHHIDPEEVAAP